MPKLIVSDPSGERETPLIGEEISIGRVANGNQVVIKVPEASRQHCRLVLEGGVWFVEDLGSSNGTRVNGRKVTKFELQDGDEISVGAAKLRFLESDASAELAPAMGDDDLDIELEISLEEEAFVRVLSGERDGERIALSGRTTFGRQSTNTVALKDKGVSGRHVEISPEAGGWILRDLGSTNGTIVDGEKVAETALEPGSRVRIGTVEMVFGLGDGEGTESLVSTVMMEEAHLDEEVFAISEGNLRRKQKAAIVVWFVFFAALLGAGWFWITQESSSEGRVVQVKSVPGNLISQGSSFELADNLEEYLSSDSDSIDFEEVSAYRRTGSESLRLDVSGDGDHAVAFTRQIENLTAADHIELGGWFRTSSLQGTAGLSLIWRDDEDRIIATSHLNAAPGSSQFKEVRGVFKAPFGTGRATVAVTAHNAGGTLWVDDVFALRLQRGEPNQNLTAHGFGVMLDPSGSFSISRDGVEVVEHGGLYRNAERGYVSIHGGYFTRAEHREAERLELEGEFVLPDVELAATFVVATTETGVTYSGKIDSGGGALHVGFGVDPEVGLVTIGEDGARRHGDAFQRSGVTAVVFDSGPRAVRLTFPEPTGVTLVSARNRQILLFPLTVAGDDLTFSLDLQLDFERERAEVTQLSDEARRADVIEKQYGKAMTLYREIFNRYPFRKDLADRARARHDQILQEGETLAGRFEERFANIVFFKTFAADRDYLLQDATAAAARYDGSPVAERIRDLIARLESTWKERHAAEQLALASNHMERGLDLMQRGRSAPELARGFFRSVASLVPGTDLAQRAREEINKIATLTGDKN